MAQLAFNPVFAGTSPSGESDPFAPLPHRREQKNWRWPQALLGYGSLVEPALAEPINRAFREIGGTVAELLFAFHEAGIGVSVRQLQLPSYIRSC